MRAYAGQTGRIFALNVAIELCSAGRREGDERLSDVSDSDPRRASGSRDDKRKPKPKAAAVKPPVRSKSPTEVGRALRSVYDQTLGERVPDDFLDLLGKLS